MFIPLRDTTFRLRTPYVTIGIIVLNGLVYCYQLTIPRQLINEWFYSTGVVANVLFQRGITGLFVPFFTALFVHVNFLHLAGNMLYLWIFGDNIEGILGHVKFLMFYLLCGILATLCQIVLNSQASLPIIGASGAISGVLGAYLLRYPRAKIQVFLWFFFIIRRAWVPALYVLGFWFLIQLSNGLGALTFRQQGGVAWFAHIGGFLAGIVLLLALEPYERKRMWKQLNQNY
jgi:membrane associated rhomboid family serine protease